MNLNNYAAVFIKGFEGYSSTPYWDVNAYRIGYGSDTLELPDGTHRKVLQTDVTTRELAEKDLARRLSQEFIPKIKNQIGASYWDKLPLGAQMALTSLAYNYGSITKSAIIDAARTGNVNKLAEAIVTSTYNDNASLPTSTRQHLRERRQKEANLAKSGFTGTPTGTNINPSKIAIVTFAVGAGAVGATLLGIYLYKKYKK